MSQVIRAAGIEQVRALCAQWRDEAAREQRVSFCADQLESVLQQITQEETLEERVRLLERAVGNCFMMAKREIARLSHHDGDESSLAETLNRWRHVQRFCETTGSKSDILRGQLPTEITDGAAPAPTHETAPRAVGGGDAALRAATRALLNEVRGLLSLAEDELRSVAGHTNVACISRRVAEADAALAASGGPSPAVLPLAAQSAAMRASAMVPFCRCGRPLWHHFDPVHVGDCTEYLPSNSNGRVPAKAGDQ